MYIQQGLATAGDLETGRFFERVIKMNVKQKLLCYGNDFSKKAS